MLAIFIVGSSTENCSLARAEVKAKDAFDFYRVPHSLSSDEALEVYHRVIISRIFTSNLVLLTSRFFRRLLRILCAVEIPWKNLSSTLTLLVVTTRCSSRLLTLATRSSVRILMVRRTSICICSLTSSHIKSKLKSRTFAFSQVHSMSWTSSICSVANGIECSKETWASRLRKLYMDTSVRFYTTGSITQNQLTLLQWNYYH